MKYNFLKGRYPSLPGFLLSCLFISMLPGCKKYLDAKSDKQLVVPVTLQDAQGLLDNYGAMNTGFPSSGALSDDDYYLADSYYNSTLTMYQYIYSWNKDAAIDNDWSSMYKIILSANVALETTAKIGETPSNKAQRDAVIGGAFFFRGFAFYHLAQLFALPFDAPLTDQKPGIPLRLKSDVSLPNVRSLIVTTYEQIIADLENASILLPPGSLQPSRPARSAAYAALARTYLTMENYPLAGKYADSALQLNSTLLNYNSLDVNAAAPFARFNGEVIFPTTLMPSLLTVTNYRADSVLYQSYDANDLRKKLFFKTNGTGSATYYTFKGSYDGTTAGNLFNGITTDEMYFVRAECFARTGNTGAAVKDLNTVLVTRWKTGTFVPFTATSAEDALVKVLTERRKELTGRALRWFDLRRLNKDSRFSKTLTRLINGVQFSLPPNDPRYTFYIPLAVVALSGMPQNDR